MYLSYPVYSECNRIYTIYRKYTVLGKACLYSLFFRLSFLIKICYAVFSHSLLSFSTSSFKYCIFFFRSFFAVGGVQYPSFSLIFPLNIRFFRSFSFPHFEYLICILLSNSEFEKLWINRFLMKTKLLVKTVIKCKPEK